MSKKRNTRNTNKSLKALKRKQYAKGGRGNVLNPKDNKLVKPKVNPSLYSDPEKSGVKGTPQTKGVGAAQQQTGPATTVISDPVKPSSSTVSIPTTETVFTGTPQVITVGLDGKEYPNPAMAAAANQEFNRRGSNPPPRATEPTAPPAGSTPPPPTDSTGGSTPDPESPTDVPSGMDNKNFGARAEVVDTGVAADAPVGIRQTAPTAELQQMESVSLDPTVGISTDVQQLSEAPEATMTGVSAQEMVAQQGKADQATVAGVDSVAEQYANKYVEQYPEWNETQKAEAKAWAFQAKKGGKQQMPSWLQSSDFNRGLAVANKMDYDTTSRDATTYEASEAERLADIEAAQSKVTKEGVAAPATAEEVKTAQRDEAAEEAAKGIAATRPVERDYAEAAKADERFTVDPITGPEVDTRTGITIPEDKIVELTELAKERGQDPAKAIKEYKDSMVKREAQTADAAQKGYTPRLGETPEALIERANYYGADYTPQGGDTEIDNVPAYKKATERLAQVGEAAQRIATELGDAPSIDLEGREAITGTAPQGNAAQIGGIPTMKAAEMQAVKGEQRKVAAEDMMEVIADVQPEITAAIAEDPASYRVQQDTDPDPVVNAAIAALPQEALVSTQMESLLAGMEEGKTPLWAKPAVDAMNQQMAARGLSVSTVGRDALFNAIIQSALPMAQSNAQALQQRAQQNLSNEQQANLATAQNTMQIRMQNLANRQTHASQTAQMAQQIKVQQGTFNQQAVMTSAEQRQQTELANAQMAQQRAQQESSQRQQAAISTLSANAQMDLANLQAESNRAGRQMDADQQAQLATYNAKIAKVMRQAELTQDMEKANLPMSLQIEMQRVSEMNAAEKDTMTAENQERLVELQTLIDFRKTDAQFAQQMDLANMSNEQQIELAMLQDRAATDSANFTADNQFRLTELNAIVQRNTRQAELNARMEEVNLDAKLKVELSELSEKNTTSRANMTSAQQTRLANLNTLVDFRKTNAAMAQQMDVANLANEQQMEMAMLADKSATDAANFTEANRTRMQALNTHVQVMSQNEQLKQNADMAKLSMQEKINLANLSSQSQADMASMSAENVAELQMYEKRMQAGQINAQLAQQMGLAELSNEQSAAMFNAQINANLDMKQFDANQQMELANSKFMQSMTATQFSADQQSAIQNATMLTQVDLANADARTRVSVENAKNFLAMDMSNLNNRQQGVIMDQQLEQQALLSDQAAQNAAKQFGATSQNQIDQFMISQSNSMKQFNTSARNAMESFNVTEANRMEAIEAGNFLQADQFSAQLDADINKFNASIETQRDQWNAANAQAVEQSNIAWRRQSNTIDTAAQNAANQQNVQNAYNISALDQTQLWQQLRDEADYIRTSYENEETRKTQLYATALANEAGASGEKNSTSSSVLVGIVDGLFG